MSNLDYNFHLRFRLWLMKWFFKSGSFICYLEVDIVLYLVQGSKYSPQSKNKHKAKSDNSLYLRWGTNLL